MHYDFISSFFKLRILLISFLNMLNLIFSDGLVSILTSWFLIGMFKNWSFSSQMIMGLQYVQSYYNEIQDSICDLDPILIVTKKVVIEFSTTPFHAIILITKLSLSHFHWKIILCISKIEHYNRWPLWASHDVSFFLKWKKLFEINFFLLTILRSKWSLCIL